MPWLRKGVTVWAAGHQSPWFGIPFPPALDDVEACQKPTCFTKTLGICGSTANRNSLCLHWKVAATSAAMASCALPAAILVALIASVSCCSSFVWECETTGDLVVSGIALSRWHICSYQGVRLPGSQTSSPPIILLLGSFNFQLKLASAAAEAAPPRAPAVHAYTPLPRLPPLPALAPA